MTKFLIKYFRQNGLPKAVKLPHLDHTPYIARAERAQRVYGFTLSIIHVLYVSTDYYYTGTRDIRGSRIGPPYARLEERLEKALVDTRTD